MAECGGFGDILKVKRGEENRTCVLKRIKFRGNVRDDPYIMSEIYCLTHLKHKNVILMHEVIIDYGEINIFMEYAEIGNLERFIVDNDSLEFVTVFKIYSQVLQGIEYCHSMEIAHRDITPANILLTDDMVVKIADFGLAVKCSSDDGSEIMCTDYLGWASYLAPEVLSQEPFLPKSSDIWSLGVTLLYLLFRSIPHKGFETEILKAQLQETWKGFVHEKTQEKQLVLKDSVTLMFVHMLDLDPKARWNIIDIVRLWVTVGPATCYVE